jgi:starch phosphorylase
MELWRRYQDAPEEQTKETIQKYFCRHTVKTLARSYYNMDDHAAYQAAAYSVRDKLIDMWNTTQVGFLPSWALCLAAHSHRPLSPRSD